MNVIQKFSDWFSKQKLIGKLFIGCSTAFIFFCLCIFVTSLGTPPTSTTENLDTTVNPTINSSLNSPEPTNTLAPTETPVPTSTPDPNLIGVGTFIVGTDIQSGLYKGVAGDGLFGSCYWARLKDLTGSLDAILANDNSTGQFYIEVKPSDFALTTDCPLTRLVTIPENPSQYPTTIETGTYLVGSDIQPGTYKGQAGTDFSDSCYWARLANVAGDLDGILSNDNATGQYYVQVLPIDFALQTGCQLEFVSP